MNQLVEWAQANPAISIPLCGWLVLSLLSSTCSVLLRVLRAAYPEPADKLPRWLRGLEAGLDEIAINSRRDESLDVILKRISERKP